MRVICLLISGFQVRALVRPPSKNPYFPKSSRDDGQEQNGSRATSFVVGRRTPCDEMMIFCECSWYNPVRGRPSTSKKYRRDLMPRSRNQFASSRSRARKAGFAHSCARTYDSRHVGSRRGSDLKQLPWRTRQTLVPRFRDQHGLADRDPVGADVHVEHHSFFEHPVGRRQEDA
jgi:hypothetical protein